MRSVSCVLLRHYITLFRVSNRVPLSTFRTISEAGAGPRPHLPRLRPRAGAELRAPAKGASPVRAPASPLTPCESTDGICWLKGSFKAVETTILQTRAAEALRGRAPAPEGPTGREGPAERPGTAGEGSHLRPGWLRPARIRRTRTGSPSRQLSAVDTRRICPPCTEKRRSSGATALAAYPASPHRCLGPGEPRPAGAHPLHDPAVYLHPVPVHGWP